MEFDDSVLIQRTNAAKLATEAEARQRMTLHCQQCNTVLGDSLGVCGEITCLDAIVCIRVTDDVVISDAMESGDKDVMANWVPFVVRAVVSFQHLQFSNMPRLPLCCGESHSLRPSRLATVRSMFLLYKANISCYMLNCCSMVTASTLTFDLKPLSESMNKVRQQFEGHLDQISRIKSRLADRRVTSEFV